MTVGDHLMLHAEKYPPHGGIDARATKRALGRPNLDTWALLLRETLQNSWDARLDPSGAITYSVAASKLDSDRMQTLRDIVFKDRPNSRSKLPEVLSRRDASMLTITDTGTRGLAGPTRADTPTTDRTDFIDFARNTGRAEDKRIGGGTYGFGKGVLYQASQCSTILLFTRTTCDDQPVSRFMAIAMDSAYDTKKFRYTGRHWWGVSDPETGHEPVSGSSAEELGDRCGLALPPSHTGTALGILAPVEDELGGTLSILNRLRNAALWWGWPHMIGNSSAPGEPAVHFDFAHEGESLERPDPWTDAELRHFAAAYLRADSQLVGNAVREGFVWSDMSIRSQRPSQTLGYLSHRSYSMPPQSIPAEDQSISEAQAIPAHDHHVALMRSPRLVVKYLEVPRDPNGQNTAGVFIAHPDLDRRFADCEPVAHDDWVPTQIQQQRNMRNPVRKALDEIKKQLKLANNIPVSVDSPAAMSGVSRLASDLGTLLAGNAEGQDARLPTHRVTGVPTLGWAARSRRPTQGTDSVSEAQPVDMRWSASDLRTQEWDQIQAQKLKSSVDQFDPTGTGHSRSDSTPTTEETALGPRTGRLQRARGGVTFIQTGSPAPVRIDDHVLTTFPVEVQIKGSGHFRITAKSRVVLDGGATESPTDTPLGADRPQVVGWRRATGFIHNGESVSLFGPSHHELMVLVSQPPDTAVTLQLHGSEDV